LAVTPLYTSTGDDVVWWDGSSWNGAEISGGPGGGDFLPLAGGTISGTNPGTLTINRNAVLPAAPSGVVSALRIVGANGENPTFAIDSFGLGVTGSDALMMRAARGTAAAPTPVLHNDSLGNLAWRGYGGSHYNMGAAIRVVGAVYEPVLGNWTDTQQGAQLTIATNPPGTTSPVTQATIGPGLAVGAPTAPSGGMLVGDVNAQRVMVNGGPVPIANGGTQATTGGAALDNLFGGAFTGAMQGFVLRNGSNAQGGVYIGLPLPLAIGQGGTGSVNAGVNGQPAVYQGSNSLIPAAAPIAIAFGGTGAASASAALTALGALPLAGGTMTGVISFAALQGIFFQPGASSISEDATGSPSALRLRSANLPVTIESVAGTGAGTRSPIMTQATADARYAPLVGGITGTAGGIPYFATSSTLGSTGVLAGRTLVLGGGPAGFPYTLSGVGSAGQVLTSNGTGADPTWQGAAGGGSGTVGSGTANQLTYYSASGTSVAGNTHLSDSGSQHLVNYNAASGAAFPAFGVQPKLLVTNVDNTATQISALSFGSPSGIVAASAGGIGTAPTAVATGAQLGNFNFAGHDGTSVTSTAGLRAYSAEPANFTTGAHGTRVEVTTTPVGSIGALARIGFEANGGVTVPPTVTGGSMGVGTINATGLYVNGVGADALSVSWLAGVNPNNAVLVVAGRAMTITGIRGVVRVANGGAALIDIKNGAGTNVNASSFDANAAAGVQTITPSVTTLAAGDFLYLSSASTFTGSIGNITVFVA
jgi:hypothetical protein